MAVEDHISDVPALSCVRNGMTLNQVNFLNGIFSIFT